MLAKKGLNDDSLNRFADITTLLGLLILGLLDTSGGLLFLPMYILVFQRALTHRQNLVLCIAPIAFLFYATDYGDRFISDGAVVGEILALIDITSYDPAEVTILDLSRFTFIIIAVTNLIILAKGVLDRQYGIGDNEIQAPMTVPAFWLTLGMFGVLPEASWLLLTMTLLLAMYSILTGKLEFIPWVPTLAFVSFLVGFSGDSNFNHFSTTDQLTHSLLGTGLFALILNQASERGWLYKWADEAVDVSNSITTSFHIKTIQGRERLTTVLRIWTIVCLTFSWTAFKGIGTIIGAIWATYDVFVNGQKYAILALPLLHAFAVWNVLEQFDQTEVIQDLLVGTVLMITGLLFTLIATKTGLAWNWELFDWSDENEYYSWIDRVGLLGIAYFLIGITWAIGEAEEDAMLWAIWATFLSGVAIQGFRDETETPWRRGLGSMGSIFSLFMLSFTFDTDLYTYITWMFMGVVALGFGFAYISRMGEVSTLFATEYTDAKEAMIMQSDDEGGSLSIPEPVLEEVEDAEIEEDDAEEEVEEETETEEEAVEEVVEQRVDTQPSASHSNFDLQLSPPLMSAIQNSLANTPHDGFRPVVSIAPNGNLKIDFVPL